MANQSSEVPSSCSLARVVANRVEQASNDVDDSLDDGSPRVDESSNEKKE